MTQVALGAGDGVGTVGNKARQLRRGPAPAGFVSGAVGCQDSLPVS